MNYKSILVHLDASDHAHPRLEVALRLAKHFNAHVTAIFAIYTPEPTSFYLMAGYADYFAERDRQRGERRAALERLFHAELTRAKLKGDWVVAGTRANDAVPEQARYADLVVAGQTDANDPETYIDDHFPENLVLSAGRPVLFVPYAGAFPTIGNRALVAWDGSREATRALHDAEPFLAHAKQVTVVTIAGGKGEPLGMRIPGSDIALTLARRGQKVDVITVEEGDSRNVGEILLSRAYETGTDLLVMGAYGHARWRELVMGGATRTLLQSMTLPVLMSH
ncbi:UspA domain-containing protein [Burkholderia sp. lig30]|uniref:universal stress protein n=1 Tax=Burkholderia sp. lig30 TaxID=1192124 RepID=UPI0004616140|nr:universal stress protein [Burkholderia sp. lig30]KDB08235.1 UspA domain-containing protein [Burkholderia sp. lig30]